MYDRSAILRSAHAGARSKLTANRAWRSYREAFADSLRQEWLKAKREHFQRLVEAEDAIAAANPLPAEIARQVWDLRLFAGAQSFTSHGASRYREIMAEADELERAARCMIIPALETFRYAY